MTTSEAQKNRQIYLQLSYLFVQTSISKAIAKSGPKNKQTIHGEHLKILIVVSLNKNC